MQEALENFWRLGLTDDMPRYLQNKVKTGNYIAVALMGVALSYWLISAIFYPQLNFIPIIGVGVVLLAIVLTYLNLHVVSRLVLATIPTALAMMYQAYLVKAGDDALVGTMMLALSFSTISFMLFDLREGLHVYLPILCSFLLIVCFPYLRDSLEMPLDDSLYRRGLLYHLTIIIGFGLNFLNVFLLAYLNLQSDRHSDSLLQKADQQHRVMEQKEQELHQHLAELQKAQEEERRRAWASEGFSRFGALLRRQDDEQQMYDALVKGIVKYIDANQAGLYLAEGKEGEVQLVLRSSYAYDRKKYRDHQLAPGQSLVGQCYLEKDYTYLTKVPQQYTYITSGLGDATPSVLLLIPLLAEEEVMGVLELASFKPIEPYVIEFLMKLGQDMAATVHISRTNQLTRRLLEESQQQAEQMRAQEEEMRQNLEELAATQEEMQRKEKEYMRQIAALKETLQLQEA